MEHAIYSFIYVFTQICVGLLAVEIVVGRLWYLFRFLKCVYFSLLELLIVACEAVGVYIIRTAFVCIHVFRPEESSLFCFSVW